MQDVEKGALARAHSPSDRSPDHYKEPHHEETEKYDGFLDAFKPGSFRRNRHARMVREATDAEGRTLRDQPPAEPALAMKLKPRHLQMIAIGGSIGKQS